MKFLIGRSPDCELVLNHACVSSRHASIKRESSGRFHLIDEGSSNGTFINHHTNKVREAGVHDDDVVFFSPEYKVPGILLLKKFLAWEQSGGRARGVLALGQVNRFRERTITIGSASTNHVVLPYLDIWPQHAVIARADDGTFFLQDLGGGCIVNGTRLLRNAIVLRPNDTIEAGGVFVSTSYDPAGDTITIGTERRGFYLTAKDVTFTIPTDAGPRQLLDRVGFSIMPGEFVGLLGPSGCGKTTLLTCLCGVLKAHGIYYNGESLAAGAAGLANLIGYVPQDDVLYPELTVRETLFYSARLRIGAHTSDARIHAKIDEVCGVLGLCDPHSRLDLRDTPVGSPERKTISGGQKKRVALAMELLTDPLVLLLDEPTSGLSSEDTRIVMSSLRRLADEKGIPIIITIHQPSPRIYKMLDHSLYLKRGRLAWFGPAYPDSVRYFVADGTAAGADEIMEAVETADAEALRARYESGPYGQKFVGGRETLITALTQDDELPLPRRVKPYHLPGQFFQLLKRQLTRRCRDVVSLAIQLAQAPLLGAMIGLAFQKFNLNSPLFLLSFVALWFGTNATARELVSERVIFKREKRGGVSPAATLAAKLSNHALMLLVQCVLLLVSTHLVLEFDMNLFSGIAILWCCGLCGAALGFVISAVARTELAATAATPLVLIPLILFGGRMVPYDILNAREDRVFTVIRGVCDAMPSRWGYEALVQTEKIHHQIRGYEQTQTPDLTMFQDFSKNWRNARESERQERINLCLVVLTGTSVGLTLAAWILLRRLS